MADEDKGAKPGTPSPVEHPAATGAARSVMDPQTEWTASDRRGPLDSAGDEDVERFVPAHETDAEGGADPATHDPIAAEPAAPEALQHDAIDADGEAPHRDTTGIDDVAGAASSPLASREEDVRAASASERNVADPARGRSLLPVAAGLVIGALIGAGSAWLVYAQAGGNAGDRQQLAALASRVDALDKRPDPQPEVTKLQSGFADLRGKVAALETRTPAVPASGQVVAPSQEQTAKGPAAEDPAPATPGQPAESDVAGKVAALQAALDEVRARTSALQAQDAKDNGAAAKVAALQTGVADAQKQAAGTQSALDALKSGQTQLGEKVAGLTIAVAGALKKADGALANAATVQSQQKTLEGKLGSPALAVVADSLRQQVDAGQPYGRQVEALAALGADPAKVAVLRENAARGVPSAQTLLTQWKPLADPVIATGNKAPANANFGQRLEHGLFGLVSVRRADGTVGNDLGSRVDLIAADLAHGDVTGAYAVWQALPADAKARSDSWGALAKTSVEALTAASDLQHSAIDALGAKKS